MSPLGSISAHGLGGAKDLPIPSELAIAGAVAALVISFTVLAVAWREPRYDPATSGREAPEWLDRLVSSRALAIALRVLGMAFFLYVGAAAVFGKDALTNPFFGTFYVLLWVGLVPASLLFGEFFKAISPARTISMLFAKISGVPEGEGMYAYPARLGYWPAALGLFAFVWLELVYPYSTDLGPVRLWAAAYLGIMLIGSAVWGTAFLERADPFEVYSSLVAKLSVWGRRDGVLVLRSPLANLDTLVARPGLVGVVGVLFGSTAFDSFRESTVWLKLVQSLSTTRLVPDTLALIAFSGGVMLILTVATMATGVTSRTPRRALPDLFAHSVVPIIVGYIVAHYLSYFVEYGQQVVIQLSDPFSRGDNYLGTADLGVSYWISSHPTFLAVTKVLAVALGHVVGVVAAHDRAIKLLPQRHQLTGQLPLLVAMVGFTVGGLYLLFAA
ncbi:hypothetical protein SAMN04489844_0314 [Nocardioides exalbidus]|uniref:Fenitrothion hydrolase n=1 Tax=Nocardioides exalbidus TaxID=402596 RepID=A0A1H4JW11_9ACTN|nr:hypothetical protein [Nocardioides exalbidus]SEB50176.1 hypothetical protein SAMN04489844_0314 [Nocardioides exalbidus]